MNPLAECAICYSLQPCVGIDDGGELICADRQACQRRNVENLAPQQPSLAQWIENIDAGKSVAYLMHHDRATFCAVLDGLHEVRWPLFANAYLMALGIATESRPALVPGVTFLWKQMVKEYKSNA